MTTDTRSLLIAPCQRLKPSRSALFLNNPHYYRGSSPLYASFSPEVDEDLIQFSRSQIPNVRGPAGEYDLFGFGQRSTESASRSPFDLLHEGEPICFPFPGGQDMRINFGGLQQPRTNNGEFQQKGITRVSHTESSGANYKAMREDSAESLEFHFLPPLLPESEEINLSFTRSQDLRKCTSPNLHHDPPTSKIRSSVQEGEGLTFITDSSSASHRQDYRQSLFGSEQDYLEALENLESRDFRVALCLDDENKPFTHNQGMRSIFTDSKEGIKLYENKDRLNSSANNNTPRFDQFRETLGQSPVKLFQSTDQLEFLPYSDIAWAAPVFPYDLGGLEGKRSGLNVQFQEHEDTLVLSGIPVNHVKIGPISSPSSSVVASDEPDTQSLLRSNLYKTELCRSWEETGCCRYATKCQFAHGTEELRSVPRHPKYKTEVLLHVGQMCRSYTDTGLCSYGKRCRFIHKSSMSSPAIRSSPNPAEPKKRSSRRLSIFQQICLAGEQPMRQA